MAETLQIVKWGKPFRSHTLLYNIEITQEVNPIGKMNVEIFCQGNHH